MDRDLRLLTNFARIYCDNKHASLDKTIWRSSHLGLSENSREKSLRLCQECRDLLEYAATKRKQCPLDPKPMCKKCRIHCYSSDYRSKIRNVMRFSGTYMIKHGRLDLIIHYFF
ncbi:MAG: nitrous oxide-stimulated promoter family protein [Candidatus Bathyarchaeota archaeon]|nr:nitrous oxide-stimulated promoter family protein [Candidatus Bathyarchaeota archaeon]